MASSEEFIPFTCVTLYSLLECASPNFFYDLHLLHKKEYSPDTISLLEQTIAKFNNCRLRLISVEAESNSFCYVNGHISSETYIRLLIPKIMRNYTDVIYLDSDLIICHDVADLIAHPASEDILLSGVVDLDVIGQYYGPELSMRYYLNSKLELKYPNHYLQAGVLVFHIPTLRAEIGEEGLIHAASKCCLRYFDQDILNYMCNQKVQLLDLRWNVVNDCDGYRIANIIAHTPKHLYAAYLNSRNSPWIVHFSGYRKPWNTAEIDMGSYFWTATERAGLSGMIAKIDNSQVGDSFKKRILNKLLPYQSIPRELAKTIFFGVRYHKR